MNVIKKIQHFARCVRIAHHIPGRIRFRLELDESIAVLDDQEESLLTQAKTFKEVLDSTQGIRSIRVNLLARSCTVEYDHNVIPFQAWQDFLGGIPSDDASKLARIIEEKYMEVNCA